MEYLTTQLLSSGAGFLTGAFLGFTWATQKRGIR